MKFIEAVIVNSLRRWINLEETGKVLNKKIDFNPDRGQSVDRAWKNLSGAWKDLSRAWKDLFRGWTGVPGFFDLLSCFFSYRKFEDPHPKNWATIWSAINSCRGCWTCLSWLVHMPMGSQKLKHGHLTGVNMKCVRNRQQEARFQLGYSWWHKIQTHTDLRLLYPWSLFRSFVMHLGLWSGTYCV